MNVRFNKCSLPCWVFLGYCFCFLVVGILTLALLFWLLFLGFIIRIVSLLFMFPS